jgi:hypothetical protein
MMVGSLACGSPGEIATGLLFLAYQYTGRWIKVQWDGSQKLDEAGNTFSTLLLWR